MDYINKIEICGRVGRSERNSYNGQEIDRFSVCVETAAFSIAGCPLIESQWFSVTRWNSAGVPALEKGQIVHVKGRVRQQKYVTPENEERTSWEILASEVEVIE